MLCCIADINPSLAGICGADEAECKFLDNISKVCSGGAGGMGGAAGGAACGAAGCGAAGAGGADEVGGVAGGAAGGDYW